MAIRQLKYGGAVCNVMEQDAIIRSVKNSIISGNWQAGEEAKKMEGEAAAFLGVKHAILTNSGSSAGLLALSALELPKGSEVIISAVTFPTIFNIILQCGLVPVVVDAEIGTYVFNVKDVEKAITKNTSAIIAVHAVGNPCDMPALMKLATKHDITVIEDNCDGWGSTINSKKVGSFGDISITSFHAAHIVSMGVGGGVFTNKGDLALRVRQYRDWGRQANTNEPHKIPTLPADYNPRFVYDKIGYNFQILELQAAMGRVQLRKSKRVKKARQENFAYLYKRLSRHEGLVMPRTVKGADVCWFAFPITTINGDRAELVAHLEANGIETRSMFAGNILRHPAYRESVYIDKTREDIDTSHSVSSGCDYILKNSFWISVHPRLTTSDRQYIIEVFEKYYGTNS